MLKTLGLIMATTLLVLFCWQSRSPAQSTANLQADIFELRSQLSQLRSEVAQLRTQRSTPGTSPSPPRRSRSPELTDSQIVDRLATLAIEAKERLNALESRVTKLEKTVR